MKKSEIRQSNMFLIIVFVVCIVMLSLVGLRYTGMVTDSVVNITVNPSVQINFTVNNVSFGFGSVVNSSNATIDTLGNVIDGNWTPVNDGFVVENAGSVNVSLYIKSTKNATSFLGGTSPGFYYNVTENEPGSCISATGFTLGYFYHVNTTDDGTLVCEPFLFDSSSDSVRIDLRLVVPSDSKKGVLESSFIATGRAI